MKKKSPEAGRASTIESPVTAPAPHAWEHSEGLQRFFEALELIGSEGDPRAIALRFVGHVAATQAMSAASNAEIFESTARLLLGVAADVRRFGWVKGPSSLDPANDNTGPACEREPIFELGGTCGA